MVGELSVDAILEMRIMSKEKLFEFFPIGTKMRLGCFRNYELISLDARSKRVPFAIDISLEVKEIEAGGIRWLVHKDGDGNLFGLPLGSMLDLHSRQVIDLEFKS